MPELPEVQTIVDDLNKKIRGDKIVGFWSDWKKTVKQPSYAKFLKEIKNKEILKAWRIGKNIFINLSGGKTLYIHLKMTGHLLVKSMSKSGEDGYFSEKVNQYIHHIWSLKNKKGENKTLEFSDLRKFGKIVLVDTKKVLELPEIAKLGVDAMSKEFTFEEFEKILERHKGKKIGIILMEQDLIAGIGNIYRSEALFDAGIFPLRESGKIKKNEKRKLYNSIRKILQKAIKMRGTSDSDYRDTSGAPGKFHKILKVYRRDGEKCLRMRGGNKCATIVKRIKLAQRSVFYCPKCQR